MNIRISIILLLLFSIFSAFAQKKIVIEKISIQQIPGSAKYEGIVKEVIQYKDNLGIHLVFITETELIASKSGADNNYVDDALYAYHYNFVGDSLSLLWKVYDFVKACSVDIEASFIKKTFQVTDLDYDGIGEVWLMYKTACHGDVSPSDMKIIMYEADKKFAMRGQNKVQISKKEFMGGNYEFDEAFNKGPSVFKTLAKKMWNKNIMQVWIE
jgi:hypothetical protein